MKEIVYGGICHFPDHPQADMHGLLRFVIKTTSPGSVVKELERYGVELTMREFNRTWGPSKSAAEKEATDKHFRDVFFCKMVHSYTVTDWYKLDKSLMLAIRMEKARLAKEEGHKIATAPRPGRKLEFQ